MTDNHLSTNQNRHLHGKQSQPWRYTLLLPCGIFQDLAEHPLMPKPTASTWLFPQVSTGTALPKPEPSCQWDSAGHEGCMLLAEPNHTASCAPECWWCLTGPPGSLSLEAMQGCILPQDLKGHCPSTVVVRWWALLGALHRAQGPAGCPMLAMGPRWGPCAGHRWQRTWRDCC